MPAIQTPTVDMCVEDDYCGSAYIEDAYYGYACKGQIYIGYASSNWD